MMRQEKREGVGGSCRRAVRAVLVMAAAAAWQGAGAQVAPPIKAASSKAIPRVKALARDSVAQGADKTSGRGAGGVDSSAKTKLGAGAPSSQVPPSITVTVANRTVDSLRASGTPRAGSTAQPGDVLRYRLVLRNRDKASIHGVVIANPIPSGVEYINKSVTATRVDALPVFSATHGQFFAEMPLDTVATANGHVSVQPVLPDRYTDVRWKVQGVVAAGDSVVATFDVRVRKAPLR